MRKLGCIVAGTLGFIMVWVGLAPAAQPLSSYNFLQDVSVGRQGGDLQIQLKFRKPPAHFDGPQFFKKSIQMDFPQAYVSPSKQYFDTGDERVRQVYISQFDPKRLRLRLILGKAVEGLQDLTEVEQVGRILKIRIRQATPEPSGMIEPTPEDLESLLERASRIQASVPAPPPQRTVSITADSGTGAPVRPSVKSPAPAQANPLPGSHSPEKVTGSYKTASSPTLDEVLKKEPVKKTTSSQPLHLKTQKAGILDFGPQASEGKLDLFSASLKMVYTLVLVLGLMFVLFHLFKKFGLKNSVFGGEGKPIKVLSTGFLAPRKSIALVEVAGDVLVIGISNDQISLLGNVADPERIEEIKGGIAKKAQPPRGKKERRAVSRSPENREEEQPPKKEKVDNYKKRLVKSGSTNPFGSYVKQFSGSQSPGKKTVKRRKKMEGKHFGEVPLFE